MRDEVRYHFGPLERRGVLLGWRGGQVAAAVAGLLSAVAALRSLHGPAGAAVAAATLGVSLGLGWLRLGGRTLEEWTPTFVRHAVGAPAVEQLASTFELLSVPWVSGPRPLGSKAHDIGVVHHVAARTLTAVLALEGHDFALLHAEEKDQRIAAWSAALAAVARGGTVVHRLQWLSTSAPCDTSPLWSYFGTEGVLDSADAARRSYADLLAVASGVLVRHRTWLAVQLRLDARVRRRAKVAGGGLEGATAVLQRELGQVAAALADAQVEVHGALSAEGLGRLLAESWSFGLLSPRRRVEPWPSSTEASWGLVRTAGTWHATYWIAEWPRRDVGAEFLAPLLLGDTRRVVSVVMEPVDPLRAARQARRAATADMADAELRRRGGFVSSLRRVREAEGVVRREAELADGHASYRFAGFVRVTAATPAELDAACQATEQAGAQCGLELRRVNGEQDRGLVATLPLAAGLR